MCLRYASRTNLEDFETSVDESSLVSGKRVSNTWIICLEVEYSSSKDGVIFDSLKETQVFFGKAPALREESVSYQLVGEVIAHQG